MADKSDDPAGDREAPLTWSDHYDAVDDGFTPFRLEAEDYVDRLWKALPVAPDSVVLDFGCGWGFAAQLVAPRIKELWCWDSAPGMRARCARNVSDRDNVKVLQSADLLLRSKELFDLVLINSVIQYLTRDELEDWLPEWRRLLKPAGRIVISDIIPPRSSLLAEAAASFRFSLLHGEFLRSMKQSFLEFRRYLKARRELPLLRLEQEDIKRLAAAAGLEAEILPANLTFRRSRLSVVLRATS